MSEDRSPHGTAEVALSAMTGAARAAELILRDGATRLDTLVWQAKGAADYLSEIDTSSEQCIRAHLTATLQDGFPDVRVLGEESWRDEPLTDALTFVVDPLDGTTNFLHGVPVYSISIAALYERELLAAVILDVVHQELYSAVRGKGARMNGKPIHVSTISEPARALIGTGFPFGGDEDMDRYAREFMPVAAATAGIRRAGSAAIDLCWLAAGRFDAFWELHLSPWDIAAGILIVREAGGSVTTLDGKPADIFSSPLVGGNPAMHAWLIAMLQRADGIGQR